MIYHRISKTGEPSSEISYDKALEIVLGTYRDCDITRDMLTIANNIDCRYSVITVTDDNGMALMAGLYNYTPTGVEYDDNGMRIQNNLI